eukprot:1996233-Prymnesium_polylepis.1
MIGFASTIEKASVKYADELAVLPLDKEVQILDEQQESQQRAYRDASDWRPEARADVPSLPEYPRGRRLLLLFGALLIII